MEEFNKKCEEVESSFKNLSNDEKKKVLKKLIWETIAHEYIEKETDAFKRGVFACGPNVEISDEAVEKHRMRLEVEAGSTVLPMVDTILGDDDELKYRLFDKFIDWYKIAVPETKEEICKYDHDYTDWEIVIGDRPVFDLDGDVEYHAIGEYYMKKCKYCGHTEKAYSKEHMSRIDKDNEYDAEHYPNKMIFTLNNKKGN